MEGTKYYIEGTHFFLSHGLNQPPYDHHI